MKKNAQVLIFEKDPFARNMIEMLLVKDWSVHVLGSDGSITGLAAYLEGRNSVSGFVDMIICNAALVSELTEFLQRIRQPLPIVVLANQISDLRSIPHGDDPHRDNPHRDDNSANIIGILLKDEILFSLGYAVSYALEGFWVKTPQVPWEYETYFRDPTQSIVVIDGKNISAALTISEEKMVRYAVIYSVERRDIADERVLSENSVYTAIYEIYKKLGVDELFVEGEETSEWMEEDPVLAKPFLRMKTVLESNTSKNKTMREALAYHYYCMPFVSLIN